MQCCFELTKILESHPDDAKQTYILVPEICKGPALAMHNNCIFLAPALVLVICWHSAEFIWEAKHVAFQRIVLVVWRMGEETERLLALGFEVLMHHPVFSQWGWRNGAAVRKVHLKAFFTSAWCCLFCNQQVSGYCPWAVHTSWSANVWLRNTGWKYHIS